MNVYVIMTVFGRESETKRVVRQLMSLDIPNLKICINDNTPDAALYKGYRSCPNVLYFRTENLYWNRGMLACYYYICRTFTLRATDRLICVNNDIDLKWITERDIQLMLSEPIFIGKFCDEAGRKSYGVRHSFSKYLPLYFTSNSKGSVATFNMNFVSFSYSVIERVGFLDSYYSHGFGDYDLGFRMTRAGLLLCESEGFIGTCSRNPIDGTSLQKDTTVIERLRRFSSIKENPRSEYLYFLRKNGGYFWPIIYIKELLRRVI